MASQEEVAKIISPYLKHDGSRYGVGGTVSYPTDCIITLRSRPFSFSARSCNKWSVGRVALVGDSAHQFPPFGGSVSLLFLPGRVRHRGLACHPPPPTSPC